VDRIRDAILGWHTIINIPACTENLDL